MIRSGIYTYGETVHIFVERKNYQGIFLPGYRKWESHYNPEPTGLKFIDHMVGNVDWNEMNTWCEFYKKVMGFAQIISFDDNDISTEYTALMSKVMSNGNGRIKFLSTNQLKERRNHRLKNTLIFIMGPVFNTLRWQPTIS